MGTHKVIRYHDFCAGHRVVGHESKCRHLHGHNYRIHFHVQQLPVKGLEDCPNCNGSGFFYQMEEVPCDCVKQLDAVGRVVDFSVVKEKLCNWLEENWDHQFIYWKEDPVIRQMVGLFADNTCMETCSDIRSQGLQSFVSVPFNPTAENMAEYLVETIGPIALKDTGVELVGVVLEETRKCSVSYFKG